MDHAEEVPAIPTTLHSVLETMHSLQDIPQIDQLTVNEYPPGVGLAPHIDTHSAFTGVLVSSLLLSSLHEEVSFHSFLSCT